MIQQYMKKAHDECAFFMVQKKEDALHCRRTLIFLKTTEII
jgi:hypothetical protein